VAEPSNAAMRENAPPKAADGAANSATDSSAVDLDKKILDLEVQLKEKDAKYLYLYAEFENYKKRAIKERSDAMKFGWENVARDLIEVMDNLERGLAHMPASTDKNLAAGLNMTLTQFRTAMQKQGVALVETVGKPFDPEFHEAIGQEPSEQPEGTIVREQLRGYTLHGRLLRPASVMISSGPLAN
jgi:molecular chaperone GrpE